MLPPLASVDELEDWMQVPRGSAPAGAADLALKIASGLVRGAAGRAFARRENTVALRIVDGRVRLPGPVVDVAAVTVAGQQLPEGPDGWQLDGDDLCLPHAALTGCPRRATVTWTHDYATVPDDVKGIVLDVAARGLPNPMNLRQETTGQRSVTFAAETIGMSLAQIEVDKLARYRPDRDPMVKVGR